MKIPIGRLSVFTLVLLCSSFAYGADFFFNLTRFDTIEIQTSAGQEHVEITTGNKQGMTTVFASPLTPHGEGKYVTPQGTVFTLRHLAQPIINDGMHHTNSGDWKLIITGEGNEFRDLEAKMYPASFGNTPKMTYIGEKSK